ncbi:peptidoglycan endopeptidase LytF precursor [Peptococcaceae bacterium CEB3]|nr:peptidoglycan endopeptidase LytF precursor [Peptococcaceae bacterium CEB3]
MGFYRRLLSLVSIGSLLVLPGTASASTLQQQLSQYQQQYNQLGSERRQQKQQEVLMASRVAGVHLTMQNLNQTILTDKVEIAQTQMELKGLNDKQQDLARQKQVYTVDLGTLLRAGYEAGSSGYIEFLLGASSWSDLFDRWDELNYMVKRYDRLQSEITDLSNTIVAQGVVVRKKAAQLQNSIQAEQAAKLSVQESLTKEKSLISSLSAQEKATIESKSRAQSNVDYIQGLIQQQQIDAENAKNHPVTGGSGGSSLGQPVQLSGTVGALVSYAEGYTGVPYLWGGTTPQGFDCSGYVQYVFKHFGINLLRTSEEQYTEGIAVSREDLKPGDIVFFSTYAPGASHNGIYIGNDTMIDAENRGVVVTRLFGSPYWGPRYIGARRVIKQ